jgi:hypothetical protein
VEVRVERQIDEASYRRLVAGDPDATFFHTSAWSTFLETTFEDHERRIMAGRRGGALVAALPFVTHARMGLRLLESMPFGTYGGPVIGPDAPADAAARLVRAFADLATGANVALAQIVDVSARGLDAGGVFERTTGTMQVVDLSDGFDAVLGRFRPSARNKLKKAEKAGVTVRRAAGRDDFLSYHRLLVASAERWGAEPPHDAVFFERLAEVRHDGVRMWLAEHEGTVVGGDLNFALNRMIMNWGNVSSDTGRRLATNNLLHAHGMRTGVEEGFELYNMGASEGLPGVRAFKASLGAEDAGYTILRRTSPLYRAAQWAARLRR